MRDYLPKLLLVVLLVLHLASAVEITPDTNPVMHKTWYQKIFKRLKSLVIPDPALMSKLNNGPDSQEAGKNSMNAKAEDRISNEAAMFLMEESDFGSGGMKVKTKESNLEIRTKHVFEKLKKELSTPAGDFEGAFEDDGSLEDLKDLRVGHLATRKFEKEEFRKLRAQAKLKEVQLKKLKPDLSTIDFRSLGENPGGEARVLKGKGKVTNEMYDLRSNGQWSRVGISKKSAHAKKYPRNQTKDSNEKPMSRGGTSRRRDLKNGRQLMNFANRMKNDAVAKKKTMDKLSNMLKKKKEIKKTLTGFEDSFTTNRAMKYGQNLLYRDENNILQESEFTEADVNNQTMPLHYLKIEVILQKNELVIYNMNNLQRVANKHVDDNGLLFDVDTILSEMRKSYHLSEYERDRKSKNDLQRDVVNNNKTGMNHIEKEQLRIHKQQALDMLETNDSSPVLIDQFSSNATAEPGGSTLMTNFSNFSAFQHGTGENFLDGDNLSFRSGISAPKDLDEGSISSEEFRNAPNLKIEKAKEDVQELDTENMENLRKDFVEDNLKELNTENIKRISRDYVDKKVQVFRDNAHKKQTDEFDEILKEHQEMDQPGNTPDNSEFVEDLPNSSQDIHRMISGDIQGSQETDDFDSNKAMLASERSGDLTADNSILMKELVYRSDEVITEGPISLTVPLITGDEEVFDEYNNFRYYYDQEYIFAMGVCEMYITEVEAFQLNGYLNKFICQYFASLIRKTEYIDYVEFAKMTMGMRLVSHFDKHQTTFSHLVSKYMKRADSSSFSNLIENFSDSIPGFLDELMGLLEVIAADYIKQWEKDYENVIKPMILEALNTFKKYGLKNDTLEMLIVSTFYLEEKDPIAYKSRVFAVLDQHKMMLSEPLGSDFFEFLPDMLRHGRRSLCNYFDIYGSNYYYSDCGFLLEEIGIETKLYSKCRAIYNAIFSIAEAIPGFCSNMPLVKNFVDDVFMKISKQLGKNLFLYNRINIEMVSDVLFEFMKERYHQVTSLLDMYKHFTYTRTRFSKQNMTDLFPLFYKLRFNFQKDAMFEYKIQVLDQNLMKYLAKVKKYKFTYTTPVSRIMDHIHREISKKEFSSRLGNKLKNYRFRESASFFCTVSTKIYMATLCELIYEKMTFPFLYKFYKYDFVFEYLNSFLLDYSFEFDMNNNEQKKVVAHFKIEVRRRMQEVRNDLINSLYLFWPQLLDKVPRDALVLILIYAKNLQMDLNESLQETIMVWINVFVEKNLERLVIPGFRVESDMIDFFWDLSMDVMERQKFVNIMKIEKVILFYFNKITDFQDLTKHNLLKNMGNLYAHYDNWDPRLENNLNHYKHTNTKALMIACKQDHDGEDIECIKNDSQAPFVESGCPEFSSKTENGLCITQCPVGFMDEGMYCKKPNVIMKRLMKSAIECDANLGCTRLADSLFIEECPKMFLSMSLMCFPKCPYGMADEGNYCKKSIIGQVTTYY